MVQQKISIQNLPAMVDIYHNLILWLINYSRETLEGKPPDKIMRMNILQKTFNVLGEDEEALLSRITSYNVCYTKLLRYAAENRLCRPPTTAEHRTLRPDVCIN